MNHTCERLQGLVTSVAGVSRQLARCEVTSVLAVALLLMAAFPPSPAQASNFSGANSATGCAGPNMADNASHSIWYDALTTDSITSVNWTRTINYNPTDVDTVNEDVPDSLTDVMVYDADYEGTSCGFAWQTGYPAVGILGFAQCLSLTGSRCQQFGVYFDNDFMGPRSTVEERWLACHELGHTFGLMHTNTGSNCMQSPGIGTSALTTHDVAHINSNY